MADPGSVLFNFQRQGLVMIDASEGEDRAFEAAMEAGAADMQPALDDDDKVVGYKVRRLSAPPHCVHPPGGRAQGGGISGSLGCTLPRCWGVLHHLPWLEQQAPGPAR